MEPNRPLLSVLALIVSQYGKQFEKLKRPNGAKMAPMFLFWHQLQSKNNLHGAKTALLFVLALNVC